jgi:hypothetical protein
VPNEHDAELKELSAKCRAATRNGDRAAAEGFGRELVDLAVSAMGEASMEAVNAMILLGKTLTLPMKGVCTRPGDPNLAEALSWHARAVRILESLDGPAAAARLADARYSYAVELAAAGDNDAAIAQLASARAFARLRETPVRGCTWLRHSSPRR